MSPIYLRVRFIVAHISIVKLHTAGMLVTIILDCYQIHILPQLLWQNLKKRKKSFNMI